jgi:integrase/recombinase XerC/integrase/recombinase XerD
MATKQSNKRMKKRGSKQLVQLERTLEYPLLAQTRKEISNQDVGFDNPAAILEVEGRQIPSPVFPRTRYNLRWEDLEKLTIPLDKLIEHYTIDLRSQNKSDRTVAWYTANLRSYERWLKKHRRPALLSDINIDTVRLHVLYLQDEHPKYGGHPYTPSRGDRLSDYSVQGHVRTLRAFSSRLQREGYLEENVLSRLRVPKAIKEEIVPLTPEEIGRILSCLSPNTATGCRSYAIVYLMLDAGLRVGEVVSLKMDNVDLDQGQLLVTGKGNKQRAVPIGSNAQKYLQRYIYHFRPDPILAEQDNVFLTSDGKALSDNSLRLTFTRLKVKTGIKRVHAHLLRHTFATYYLRNGGDLLSLQKILGHTSLEMVRVYSHLAEADVKAKHRRYSPMDRLELKGLHMAVRRPSRGKQ